MSLWPWKWCEIYKYQKAKYYVCLEHIVPYLKRDWFSFGGQDRKSKCVMFWKILSLCLAYTNQLSNAHVSKKPRSKQQLPPTNSSAATLASPLHLHLRSLKQRRCQQKDCQWKKNGWNLPRCNSNLTWIDVSIMIYWTFGEDCKNYKTSYAIVL